MVSAVLPKIQDGTPTHSDTKPERHNPPGGRASGERPWPNSESMSNLGLASTPDAEAPEAS